MNSYISQCLYQTNYVYIAKSAYSTCNLFMAFVQQHIRISSNVVLITATHTVLMFTKSEILVGKIVLEE